MHVCSWGSNAKVVCTANLWAIEPKVACPVIKLLFLPWFRLTASCLATSDISRYAHAARRDLCEGENPGTAGRSPFALGPLTAAVDGPEQVCAAAASGLQQPHRLISAATQADRLYPKALTNIKLVFPPPIFHDERQPVSKPLSVS